MTREGHAVAAVAGRHHAIEHVDAAPDRFQEIVRRADPHQIARAVRRQRRRRLFDDLKHDILRLADRQAADGVAVKADIDQLERALLAQGDVVAALHDAEQRITVARPAREGAFRAFAPAQRQFHRPRHVLARGRQPQAFVELHGNVGAEQRLDLDRAFGRELVHGAVEMRAEHHVLLGQLAQARQRHHLEAAGIGEDRARPVHEGVQAAQRGDALGAGAQHQMVGIAEHDLGAGVAHHFRCQPLHRRLRADRHEGRRLHAAVRRDDLAAARGAVGFKEAEGEGLAHALFRHGRACRGHPRLAPF